MKNRILLLVLITASFLAKATNYTSVANGNWNSSSTWSPSGIPGSGDNVTINTNVTVGAAVLATNVTINSGFTLTLNGDLGYSGTLTNNGAIAGASGIGPMGNGTILSGNGRYSSYSGTFYLQGTNMSSNATIIDAVKIVFDTHDTPADMVFTNNGFLTLTSSSLSINNNTYTYTFINGAGATVITPALLKEYTNDTLYFTATNNTVAYGGGQMIDNPKSSEFYNIRVSSIQFAYTITILNNLQIESGGALNMNGHNVNIGGSLYDSGSITNNTGTFTFNGTGNQTIGGNTSVTFKNLTINSSDTVFTALAETVSNNLAISGGILDCENNQLTGNTTGTFTMSSGTGLVLGLTSSSTGVSFPTSFTTAHTTLNSASTVTYQANTSQTISNVPTYGNLTLSTATTKTLGGSITVAGNLTVNSNTTLDCEAYQITGNSTGTLSMASGSSLILGSTTSSTAVSFPYKFTSAHISLNAASTVTYQANANQTVSDTATYGNLVLNTGSSSSSKTPNGSITLGGSLTIDNNTTMVMNSHAMTIAGNFTDNGTFNYGMGTVTFDGSANENLNGSSVTDFFNLTLNTTAATDTLFLNSGITVYNTLTTTQGILDCQKNQLTNSATPGISATESASTICPGATDTLRASSYTNYIWFPATGLNATTGTPVVASPTSATTYTVYGINSHTYTCGLGTDVVSLYTPPTVSATASSLSICAAIPDTLKSTPSGGTSPYTYLWTSTAYGDITNPTNQNTTAYPFGSTYTITVTDAHGCTGNNTVGITVYPPPFVTVTGPLNPVCSSSSDTLIVSGANTYSWSTGATTSSIIVAPTSATTYTILGTNTFGCVDSAQYIIDPNCSGTGHTSGTAIPVTAGSTCTPYSYSTLDSVMWFSFSPADSNNQIVALSNIIGVSAPHVHRLTLYNSSLHTIEDRNMPEIQGATELRIDAARLTPGNTYYVRVARTGADSNIRGNNPTPNPIGEDNASMRWTFEMCFRTISIFVPQDSGSELPAVEQLYYEGRGQIADMNDIPRFDIKAYTNFGSPALYCQDSVVSFVYSNEHRDKADTLQRVDMVPTGAYVQHLQRTFKMEKDSSAGYLNYIREFAPNGVSEVEGYSRVVYKNVFPNIDMHLYSNTAGTKLYFVCNPSVGPLPGGNPANIELKFSGANSITILPDSGLSIVTALGTINFAPGYAYEDSAGIIVARTWKANFEKVSSNVVRFHTGAFNSNEPLVIQVDQGHKSTGTTCIDNLCWSTYFGGTKDGNFIGLTTDNANNVYATGLSGSTNFPVTIGVIQPSLAGQFNAVIAKFAVTTHALDWATYYGGKYTDEGNSIAVDASQNVYITGYTNSPNFPIQKLSGAYNQSVLNGTASDVKDYDAFIVKLGPTGKGPAIWATFYGGANGGISAYPNGELGNHILVDNASPNNLYVVGGYLSSIATPVTVPTYTVNAGQYYSTTGTGWIAEFSLNGVQEWGTTIGGSNTAGSSTTLVGASVDASNNLFVTGQASETGYPSVNAGANATYVPGIFSGLNAVATKFNTSNAIVWSTYYAGDGDQTGYSITNDNMGNAYITGNTTSPGSSVPLLLTTGPYNQGYGSYATSGVPNAFIAEFAPLGTMLWSTYFGTGWGLYGQGITYDNYDNNLYLTGYSANTGGLIPLPTSNPAGTYSITTPPGANAFLAAFNSWGYIWGTYFGGNGSEVGWGIVTDGANNLYIDGQTNSTSNFPLVDNPSTGTNPCYYNGSNTSTINTGYISQFTLTSVVGINPIKNPESEITVYPNPTSQNITVEMELKEAGNVEFSLYDLLGQSVYSDAVKEELRSVSKQISLSGLSEGTYILKIVAGNAVYHQKIIKLE